MEKCVNVLCLPKTMCSHTFPRGVYLTEDLTTATVNVDGSEYFFEGTDLFRGLAGALLAD